MPAHTKALGALSIAALAAACSSAPSGEGTELDAADLQAMAAPGVDETALNRSVDPCTDFYEFACGGYIASLPADTEYEMRSASELQKDRDAILGRVVDAVQAQPRSDAERKAGALFTTCMADDAVAKSAAFLASFRPVIESATTPSALAGVIAQMHRRNVAAFFAIMSVGDALKSGRVADIAVIPNGFNEIYTDADRAFVIDHYITALLQVEPSLGQDEAKRIATGSATVETALTQALLSNGDDNSAHPIGRPGLASITPSMDWNAYFGALGRTNFGDFPVYAIKYFTALDEVLKTSNIADVQAYLIAQYYTTESFISTPSEQRRSYCASELEWGMSDAIEPRFLELAGVDGGAKAKARALWTAVVDAFQKELDEEPFLDAATRVEAQTKLRDMRGAIGGSRKLEDYAALTFGNDDSYVANDMRLREYDFENGLARSGRPIPLLHVDFPAPVVNASYNPALNKINVPGGILGGYFFSPSAPKLANFAALGTVLGHELTHGFDNQGRYLDGNGAQRDWWTPSVEAAFNARSDCMRDQYSAFTLEGVVDPVTGQMPGHVNGAQTLGENIADNGGLKTAYRASNVEGMTTPVVAGFSPPQQFFISYAQLWCSKSSPKVASEQLADDVHSPEKARVNIPLQNMAAFASAFQCTPGMPMVPANRCSVW